MDPNLQSVDFRDFWHLAPAIVLSVLGLVVLLADLAWARRMSGSGRRQAIGWLTLAGLALALLAELGLIQVQSLVRGGARGAPAVAQPLAGRVFSGVRGGDLPGHPLGRPADRGPERGVHPDPRPGGLVVDGLVVHRGMGRVLRPGHVVDSRHDAAGGVRRAGHAVPHARDNDHLSVS